eukprot:CAMPEP_0184862106 /NCGR_PEP_ID=MMETSP0580-20130426/6627_1 /TAXON_ID=1118495 /ORGANISM="Dactyliosolen fragilissimus" /LENGTH=707 /DNA_ID=CAMNT_0027359833 /DNA_START=66 /DNA_END=2186 /DNA_ORIENTATION=+
MDEQKGMAQNDESMEDQHTGAFDQGDEGTETYPIVLGTNGISSTDEEEQGNVEINNSLPEESVGSGEMEGIGFDQHAATSEENGLLSEETPLIHVETGGLRHNTASFVGSENEITESSTQSSDIFCDPEKELEMPWPATLERSLSILAGPTMDTKKIEAVTRSPKIIGLNQMTRAKRSMKDLKRGYHTPDPSPGYQTLSPEQQFMQGIKKMKSLDFSSATKKESLSKSQETLVKQEMKAMEAKLYRQKLLNRRDLSGHSNRRIKRTSEEYQTYSPGYQKELETDSIRKEIKKDEMKNGHGSQQKNKASYWQCVFNMANILMGVGMLGLPYVFASAGWIGGVFVSIIFGLTAYRTSILLGRMMNGDPRPSSEFNDDPFKTPTIPGSTASARMCKPIRSFPGIARIAFGQYGNILLSIVLYFELFSCLCIFLVTMGDHLNALFPSKTVTEFQIYSAFALIIPIALLNTPTLLSYLSAVGTFATIAVVLSVLGYAISEGDVADEMKELDGIDEQTIPPYHILWRTAGLPIAFGMIAYTYSGHAIIPNIYVSMEKPREYESMIRTTFVIVFISCLVVAASGYYLFGSTVDDQITVTMEKFNNNLGTDDGGMDILTGLMILTAFSKFVLSTFPLSLGMEEIIAPSLSSDKAMEFVSIVIKLILIFLSLLVAIYVPSFSLICSLVGLICTMTVSVIFPAMAHLKIFGKSIPLW